MKRRRRVVSFGPLDRSGEPTFSYGLVDYPDSPPFEPDDEGPDLSDEEKARRLEGKHYNQKLDKLPDDR